MPAKLTRTLHRGTKGSRARGQQRAQEILRTAQEILANEGYRSLTLRKIATTMGISNGNITYYFANKEQLLKALITDNLARYDAAVDLAASGFPDHPESRLRAFLDFLIRDAQDPNSQRFFYQLWAISSHNEGAAIQREAVYEHFLNQVRTLLRAARPEMTEDDLLKKCFVLMSLIEGMNVIYGSGENLNAKFSDKGPWALEQVLQIALS
jgi:AcrR family transcriptional regulator